MEGSRGSEDKDDDEKVPTQGTKPYVINTDVEAENAYLCSLGQGWAEVHPLPDNKKMPGFRLATTARLLIHGTDEKFVSKRGFFLFSVKDFFIFFVVDASNSL